MLTFVLMTNTDEIRGLVGLDIVAFYSCYLQKRLYCCKDFVKYAYVSALPLDQVENLTRH